MKKTLKLALFAALAALVAVPSVLAQRQLGKKKGPTSKLYLAETKGEGQIVTEGKAYDAKQATAFDAPGTVIETKDDSHQAFVYSNGVGMYVDANTRLEVDRFVQEPFEPARNNNSEYEPSISQSDIFLARGTVDLCTGQLVSGTTMNYGTPQGGVAIRGGKIAMTSEGDTTTVYLLEGDATVRGGTKDVGGTVLHNGEKAIIRNNPTGGAPTIEIQQIEPEMVKQMDEKVTVACNARKTVTFEVIEKKSELGPAGGEEAPTTQEITPRPTITETTTNNNIVESPSTTTDQPGG